MSFEPDAPLKPEQAAKGGLDALIKKLKEKQLSPEQKKLLVEQALSEVREAFAASDAEYVTDMNAFYGALRGEDLLVRRHDPEQLINAVRDQEDIALTFDPKVAEEYANAAEWNFDDGARGLRNAFLEGWTRIGPMTAIVLFRKGPDLEVKDIQGNMKVIGDIERGKVRIAKGVIHPDDIQGVVISAPAGYFPESEMTEDERERYEEGLGDDGEADLKKTSWPIHRGFLFGPTKEKRQTA